MKLEKVWRLFSDDHLWALAKNDVYFDLVCWKQSVLTRLTGHAHARELWWELKSRLRSWG